MTVLHRDALEASPLADLHAIASELGIDGFRRLRKADLVDRIVAHQGGDDVYISAAQVRRCELVSGDRVAGPVRRPRRSERYPSLVRVDTINGKSEALRRR